MTDNIVDPEVTQQQAADIDAAVPGEYPDDDDTVVEGVSPPLDSVEAIDQVAEDEELFDPFDVPLLGCNAEQYDATLKEFVTKKYSSIPDMQLDLKDRTTKLHRLSLDSTVAEEQPTVDAFMALIDALSPEELMQLKAQDPEDSTLRYRNTLPLISKSDSESLTSFMRRFHQTRGEAPRIPLVHSGITVELKSPGSLMSVIEMSAALTKTAKEYGTSLGGLYFSNASFLSYKTVWQTLIANNITWASIKDRDWRNNLQQYISFNDFDTLLIAIAQLLHPDGFDNFVSSCLNPECDHTTTLTIMPRNLIRTNEYKLLSRNPKAHEHLSLTTHSSIDPFKISEYKNSIYPQRGRIIQVNNSIIFLRVPNLKDTFDAGSYYAGLLQSSIKGSAPHTALAIHHSLLGTVSHWVARIVTYRLATMADDCMSILANDQCAAVPTNGIITDAVDHRAITEQLLVMGADDGEYKLYETIEQYAQESRLTIPAVEDSPCPACGHTGASLNLNKGFRVVNPLHLFFSSIEKSLDGARSLKGGFRVI